MAVRRKLVMEISDRGPSGADALVRKIAATEPQTDCLVGERQWQDFYDR